MIDLARHRVTLWKNVRGKFYTIDCVKALISAAMSLKIDRIRLASKKLRMVLAGFGPEGASDLIGFKRVLITPDMLGQTIAVFVALEVKKDGGRASLEQLDFCRFIEINGGLSGVTHSPEQSRKICKIEG